MEWGYFRWLKNCKSATVRLTFLSLPNKIILPARLKSGYRTVMCGLLRRSVSCLILIVQVLPNIYRMFLPMGSWSKVQLVQNLHILPMMARPISINSIIYRQLSQSVIGLNHPWYPAGTCEPQGFGFVKQFLQEFAFCWNLLITFRGLDWKCPSPGVILNNVV